MSDPAATGILTFDDIPDPTGPPPEQPKVQVDYWGVEETKNVLLPDGVSFVTIRTLTEGDRRSFLNATNKEMRIDRSSQEAHLKLGVGDERYELLRRAIVGWNLVRDKGDGRGPQPVVFNSGTPGSNLEQWLDKAPPTITETIELEIRKMNPWLQADLSVEEIDKQIEQLVELRETKKREEEGNGHS